MHDKYDRNDSLVSWMIAGGARLDEPDARHLSHLVALRDARLGASPITSPIAWLAARFGARSAATGAAAAATSTTTCCSPA